MIYEESQVTVTQNSREKKWIIIQLRITLFYILMILFLVFLYTFLIAFQLFI